MIEPIDERRKKFMEESKTWSPEPIHELFSRMAEKYSSNKYISCSGRTFTYKETKDKSKLLAGAFLKAGLQENENIALILPNYAEFIFSRLGISFAGGIAVPLNYRLRENEFKYLINQSDSSYIITLDRWNEIDYISILKKLSPETFKGEKSKNFPHLRKIIIYSPEGNKYDGTVDFYDFINTVTSDEANKLLENVKKIPFKEVSDIMYTSGTTSLPKGVLVTHEMIWKSAIGSCINRGYQKGRKVFVPIPFYHTFAFIEGFIATTMVGGELIMQSTFDENEALDLIEKHHAYDVLCVPTIGLRLIQEQASNPRDLSSLNAMYCAGSEASPKMWKDLKDVLNIQELNTGYGMTEIAAGVLQTDPNDDISYLTKYVGKVIPGGHFGQSELNGNNLIFKVKNINTGEYEDYGVEGELVCKGPLVTKGYYKKEKETQEVFDENGWLKTGDLAILHENGYISLTGRIKEIYRIGAENVAPKEIEEVLNKIDKVSEAYVVGVPDQVMGEVGMAWIVPKQDANLTKEEVILHASKHLARFKVPKYIKFVTQDELPCTSNGKVQKFKLQEWFINNKEKLNSVI